MTEAAPVNPHETEEGRVSAPGRPLADASGVQQVDRDSTPGSGGASALRRRSTPISALRSEAFQLSWALRGVWLGPVAWLLALIGTLMLPDEGMRDGGVALIVIAAVLAVASWGAEDIPSAFAALSGSDALLQLDRDRAVRLGGIVLAALIAWQADAQFLAHPNQTFGVAGYLWLLGMASLIFATAGWPRPAGEPGSWTWGIRSREWVVEGLVIAGLVALAVTLRVWNLQGIPFAIHADEIMTGRVATQAYLTDPKAPIFSTVWNGINLPALWFAAVAASLKLTGATLAGLRLPAALFGAAIVLPFYGVVRLAWGRSAALGGTALLVASAADVHFSRVTVNNIVTPFFWTVCFFFLLRGLSRRRPVDWVLAGIAAGLSEYGYYGTHLLPFILLGFVCYLALVHRYTTWQSLGHFALLAMGYVAAFGPLLAYDTRHPGVYFGRGQGVLTWSHIPRSLADLHAMWTTLWPLMAENLLGISTHTDQGSFYWAPLLLPGEAALLVLGVALFVWRWRYPPAFLMLLSGVGTLFVGGTLVHGVPFIQHWTPAFPAFYAAIAAPIGAWAESARRQLSRHVYRAGALGLALTVMTLAWLDVDFYFHRYQATRPEFEIRAAQSRWETALGLQYRVRTVGRTWQPYDRETNEYLLHGQDGAAILDPARELPLPGKAGKGLAFVFFPDEQRYEPLVRSLYPGGTSGEVRSHFGVHLFDTYLVPPAEAQAAYGVHLELAVPLRRASS